MIDLLGDRPPAPAELDDARRSLIEGQTRHFETPTALVSRFGGAFLLDLPPDEHQRFPDRLAAVTGDSALAAAHRHIHPDEMSIIISADSDAVAVDLERISWAQFERVENLL